jgi:hypothetical protein
MPSPFKPIPAPWSRCRPANLGAKADGGTAHQQGDLIYASEGSADSGGLAAFSVSVASDLLTPGRGATLRLTVTCTTGASMVVYRTSLPIRESGLRLLVTLNATTRGGSRQLFQLGRPAAPAPSACS